MTVSNMTRKAGPSIGNGTASSYSFDFKVFGNADVCVTRTNLAAVDETLTLDSDYTVSLNAGQDPPGGSVNLAAPLPNDFKLTLTSNVLPLQPIDITNSGGFYPDVVESALDRQTILAQQVIETLGRSITLPVSLDPSISTQLGAPVPNGVLAWNGTADQLITTTPESLSVSVNADDVRAALLAAAVVDGDTLRAPCGDAVADAIAVEVGALQLAIDGLADLVNLEASARTTAISQEISNRNAAIATAMPPATIVEFDLDSVPAGFVYADGGTIGDGASGASTRANADTANLFVSQWTRNATLRPLYDSTGSPVARGASAAADFAAHCRIRIGDLRDRVTRGYKSAGLGPAVGDTQEDAFQGHAFQVPGHPNSGGSGFVSTNTNTDTNGPSTISTIVSDGSNGTPRTASETRVKSFGTLKCYKL